MKVTEIFEEQRGLADSMTQALLPRLKQKFMGTSVSFELVPISEMPALASLISIAPTVKHVIKATYKSRSKKSVSAYLSAFLAAEFGSDNLLGMQVHHLTGNSSDIVYLTKRSA